eukprot:6199152-Pleurochrysis_carterae.AAC.2
MLCHRRGKQEGYACVHESTFHGPVVDGVSGDEGNGRGGDPLPEDDGLSKLVALHLALHLHVEDLEVRACLQRDHFGDRVHDGRLGSDGSSVRLRRVRHLDNDNLRLPVHLLADADVLVAFHRERCKADVLWVDAHIGKVQELQDARGNS